MNVVIVEEEKHMASSEEIDEPQPKETDYEIDQIAKPKIIAPLIMQESDGKLSNFNPHVVSENDAILSESEENSEENQAVMLTKEAPQATSDVQIKSEKLVESSVSELID